MTMSTDWKTTKANAVRRLSAAGASVLFTRQSGAVEEACEDTANFLNWLEDRITHRVANARTAANSASMTLGSMHVYWKTSKKSIEAEVKRAGNAVDTAGMKKMLSEFDSGLGKELDAFEAAYPDVARMRQSNERIRQIVKRYKNAVAKTEKKPGEDKVSDRLAADLQTSLNNVFDGIDERINALLDDLVTSANNAFWSVSAVNR